MTSSTLDVLHLVKSALRYISSFITDKILSDIGEAQPSLYDIKMYYTYYHNTQPSQHILDAIDFLTINQPTDQPPPDALIATIIEHRPQHQQPLQHILDQVQDISDNITDTDVHHIIGSYSYVHLPQLYYFYQKQSQLTITIDHDNLSHINRCKEQLHRCRQLIYANPFSSQ